MPGLNKCLHFSVHTCVRFRELKRKSYVHSQYVFLRLSSYSYALFPRVRRLFNIHATSFSTHRTYLRILFLIFLQLNSKSEVTGKILQGFKASEL